MSAGALAKRVRRFAFLIVLSACGGAGPPEATPPVLIIDGDTIALERGARIIDVSVRARDGNEFEPATSELRAGDVLRITGADQGPHALVFDEAGMAADVRTFLERTDQLRGPPLLARGAAWLVSLSGAPAGRYMVRCLTHGGDLRLDLE